MDSCDDEVSIRVQKCCKICMSSVVPHESTMTEKVYKNCFKYLHSTVIENNSSEDGENGDTFLAERETSSICFQCFESAVHLADLNDQLETLQKSIYDFIFTFSTSVLRRRGTTQIVKSNNAAVDIPKLPEDVFKNSDELKEVNNDVPDPLRLVGAAEADKDAHMEENSVKMENFCATDPAYPPEEEFILSNVPDEDQVITVSSNVRLEPALNKCELTIISQDTDEVVNGDMEIESETSSKLSPPQLSKPDVSTRLSRKKSSSSRKSTTVGYHHKIIQLGANGRYCGECKKELINTESFKRHMKLHILESPFKCLDCTMSFRGQPALTRHMRETHMYKCPECTKILHSILERDRHLEEHKNVFPCRHCGSLYTTTENRDRHERTHVREKKFKCQQCTKSFSTKACLDIHTKFHAR